MNKFIKKILYTVLASFISVSYAQFPNDFALKDLEKEISKKEDCAVFICNTVNKISITEVVPEKSIVKLLLNIDARIDSIVTLPLNASEVSVRKVLLNKKNWYGSDIDKNGKISIAILKGSNTVELEIFVKGQVFSLQGYQKRIADETSNKAIKINNSGTIEVVKESNEIKSQEIISKFTTNPFFIVERTLLLEQKWKMKTTVKLLDGIGNNTSRIISINALQGESVLSNDIKNEDGKIKINITNDPVSWDSILEEKAQLNVAGSPEYMQKFNFINNSNWLFNFNGLEAINKDNNSGYASSYSWIFWPEDKLVLNINKPLAIKGDTIAVQSVKSSLNTEKSPNEMTYNVEIKSSLGTKIKFQLPENLKLIKVTLNNQNIPFKIEKDILFLDINSGLNTVSFNMDMSQPIGLIHHYPQIKIEAPATNFSYNFGIPKQRWAIWTGGANIRASILLWGILISCVVFAYPLSKAIKSPLNWFGWSILLVGLSQSGLWGLLFVIIWFSLINYKHIAETQNLKRLKFNALQVIITVLTVIVFSSAIQTVAQGLLNYPNLFIEGEGSSYNSLNWYSEQLDQFMPWVLSVPMWVYRVLMFSWSIWFAFNIMKWLKWAWEGFSSGGLWIPAPPKTVTVSVEKKL